MFLKYQCLFVLPQCSVRRFIYKIFVAGENVARPVATHPHNDLYVAQEGRKVTFPIDITFRKTMNPPL